MTRPKQHHYLPESYQEQFVNSENRIFFLDKNSGEVRKTSPKSFGKEKDLYTLDVPPEGKLSTYIENPFLSDIDGTYPDLIQKLKDGVFLESDRSMLAQYLGYLRNRTPSYFRFIEEVSHEIILKEIYQEVIKDSEKLAVYQNDALFDMSSEDSFIQEAINHMSTDKDHIIKTFLRLSPKFTELIESCNWEVMVSDTIPFISSDKAFAKAEDECIFVNDNKTIYKRYFLIPLASSICLKLSGEESKFSKRVLTEHEVLDVNECISYCAEKWIIGTSEEVLLTSYSASETLLAREAIRDFISELDDA